MKIAALCDSDTAIGLRLAGVHEVLIAQKGSLNATFQEIIKRTDLGLVIITEKIANDLGSLLKEFRMHQKHPIFIEIPDKHGKLEDHIDIVSHLMKRAVGIDISKKEN